MGLSRVSPAYSVIARESNSARFCDMAGSRIIQRMRSREFGAVENAIRRILGQIGKRFLSDVKGLFTKSKRMITYIEGGESTKEC